MPTMTTMRMKGKKTKSKGSGPIFIRILLYSIVNFSDPKKYTWKPYCLPKSEVITVSAGRPGFCDHNRVPINKTRAEPMNAHRALPYHFSPRFLKGGWSWRIEAVHFWMLSKNANPLATIMCLGWSARSFPFGEGVWCWGPFTIFTWQAMAEESQAKGHPVQLTEMKRILFHVIQHDTVFTRLCKHMRHIHPHTVLNFAICARQLCEAGLWNLVPKTDLETDWN